MEYYKIKYNEMKKYFNEDDVFTWNVTENKHLVLFKENKPFAKCEIKKIGVLIGFTWTWCWELKEQYIDINFYPKNLKKNIPDSIRNGKEDFPKIVHSLEALKGEWYIYLDDTNDVKHIVIITKIIKLF